MKEFSSYFNENTYYVLQLRQKSISLIEIYNYYTTYGKLKSNKDELQDTSLRFIRLSMIQFTYFLYSHANQFTSTTSFDFQSLSNRLVTTNAWKCIIRMREVSIELEKKLTLKLIWLTLLLSGLLQWYLTDEHFKKEMVMLDKRILNDNNFLSNVLRRQCLR